MLLFLFGLFLAIWIPTIVIIIWKKKTQSRWISLLLGVAVAIISEILLEITRRINFLESTTAEKLLTVFPYEILQKPILYTMHSALLTIVILSVWRMSMLHTKSLISTHKEAVMLGLGFLVATAPIMLREDVPDDPAADAALRAMEIWQLVYLYLMANTYHILIQTGTALLIFLSVQAHARRSRSLTLFFLTALWITIGMEVDYHVEPYKFTAESWAFVIHLFFALSIAPFAYIVPVLRNQPKN